MGLSNTQTPLAATPRRKTHPVVFAIAVALVNVVGWSMWNSYRQSHPPMLPVTVQSSPAIGGEASKWVSVSEAQHGGEEFADVASIEIEGDIRRAQVKTAFAPHTEKDPNDPSKWWESKVNQMAFNCKEGTSRRESMTINYSDGTQFSIPSDHFPESWKPVQPNTMLNEDIFFICGWKAK